MLTTEEDWVPAYKQLCVVDGCGRIVGPHSARGMCNAHYKRARAGKPLYAPIQIRGAGWISSHGYRYVGDRAEHRLIIERHLGRALSFNEVVHHKDGDPTNNDLRNLEVLDRGEHIRLHTLGKSNEQRKIEKASFGYCLAGKPDHV